MSQDEHEKEGYSQKTENIQSRLQLLDKPIMHELIIESSKKATKLFEQVKDQEGDIFSNLRFMKKSTDVFIKRSTIKFTVNDLHSDLTKIMIDEIPDIKKSGSFNETSLNTSLDG
jgi:hypothetical protein